LPDEAGQSSELQGKKDVGCVEQVAVIWWERKKSLHLSCSLCLQPGGESGPSYKEQFSPRRSNAGGGDKLFLKHNHNCFAQSSSLEVFKNTLAEVLKNLHHLLADPAFSRRLDSEVPYNAVTLLACDLYYTHLNKIFGLFAR